VSNSAHEFVLSIVEIEREGEIEICIKEQSTTDTKFVSYITFGLGLINEQTFAELSFGMIDSTSNNVG
jgi:hypothetical protein